MKFESYKADSGGFRWRLREESGQVVSVRSGKIMGVASSPSKKKASERVLERSLERLASSKRSGTKVGGKKKRAPSTSLKTAKG
jgi:hypothetical protein